MRRKDREMDENFGLEVLRDCEYGVLSTVNKDGTPYCIPVSPVVLGRVIYFHCAPEGKKLDNIALNNKVCIAGVKNTKLLPQEYSTQYESGVATGVCTTVTDESEKIEALRLICEKYAKSNMEAFEATVARSLKRTTVCKIILQEITGKAKLSKTK